ncbi:MAG: gamma-glutamyltransferase [Planctomycetota bacterium]|jgi:gamma-glutamyltranspeptidase/glutathione hydrolase
MRTSGRGQRGLVTAGCELAAACWLVLAAFVSTAPAQSAPAQSASAATKYFLATVHPSATEAGLEVFRQGGNAVDAAVTAALTLGVVDGFNSGIGGGCFILVRTAEGKVIAIDARETAPAAAFREMYLRQGEAQPDLSATGPLAVATPGALAGYAEILARGGRRTLAQALEPGRRLAAEGFELDEHYIAQIRSEQEELARFPGAKAILLRPDGTLPEVGSRLVQADLARTYQQIASSGPEWFYRGEFAAKIADWMAENGGLITREDFAQYRTVERDPLVSRFRGYTVLGFPPPSSGGVHLAQILNLLEQFDLAAIEREDPAAATHLIAEAMKLAFADRAHWLGDPDFAQVPRGLLDPQYARELAGKIDRSRASEVSGHGRPPRSDSDFFGPPRHTTHIAAADAEGNWVAITATVNTTFGSKVIVPGTGVILNNEMDDFSIAPGVPNKFKLIGGEANAVAALKRPLSSMSPTIVLAGDQPVMTVGAAGGPRIITATLLAIVRHLEFGWPLEKALGAQRFHHQWMPGELTIEEGFDPEQSRKLEALGHKLKVSRRSAMAEAQAIRRDPQTGRFEGYADPRTAGTAAGD